MQSLPKDKKILFVPDKNLGAYIQKVTGREMEIWNGDCCVHNKIDTQMVLDKLYSTAGIIKHAKESPKQRFIIATELETIHKLQADNPTKEFIPIHPKTICGQMKKVTLEKVLETLEKEQYEVRLPEDLREKAWLPIQRMLDLS